eukprot:XP_011424996.1 PREDICTED: uncharacterized protein LOC105326565 [Crassostrea gigas]
MFHWTARFAMFHRTASNVVLLLILSVSIWTISCLCVKDLSIHEHVKEVKQCPYTKNGWIKAAEKKNCTGYQGNKTYVYHCVINEWANATVEVCAKKKLIILGKCTEYNVGAEKIQGSEMRSCDTTNPPCPHVYNSTDAYKYKSCYNFRIDSENKQNWSSESNSTRPLLILQNNPVEDGSEVWEMIFPLSIGGACFVLLISLLVFVLYRRRIKNSYTDSQTDDSEVVSTLVNHVQNSNLK